MWSIWIAASVLLAGCAVVPATEPSAAPAPDRAGSEAERWAEGGGSLRHEQISISISAGMVDLRVTSLDQAVLRLAASDVRRRLESLALAVPQAESGPRTSFLVSFTARAPGQLISPTELRFEVGGRRVEITDILPVTDGWGEQRLRLREPQAAVYVLRERLDPFGMLRISYGTVRSDGWRDIIPVLRAEERRLSVSVATPP